MYSCQCECGDFNCSKFFRNDEDWLVLDELRNILCSEFPEEFSWDCVDIRNIQCRTIKGQWIYPFVVGDACIIY